MGRPTWLEETKGTVKVVFVVVAQHRFILMRHLLVSAQDDEQKPRIPLPYLTRVPLRRGALINIASDARGDGGPCRQAARHRQMDARGEERIDEAPRVPNYACKGEAVRAGVVRKVGSGFHLCRTLAGADELQQRGCKLEGVGEEVEVRGGCGFLLGCNGLVHDHTDRGSPIMQGDEPSPSALVWWLRIQCL